MNFEDFFHKHILKITFIICLPLLTAWAIADEIEEIVVTAQQEKTIKADPITSSSLMSAIMPVFTWNAGGYGGFVGYNERGAQTSHTSVYVNGIPANDPGASWYDFGHDFASGQTVKVISGANGVIYGSGSMAGTVLIQDTIERGITLRMEDEIKFARVAPIDQLEFSMVNTGMDSVRNDNDEEDNYENKTVRFNVDAGDFSIVGKFTEYEYDYDNCYDYNWGQSNDCLQDGQRYNVAIRNDYITIGRNYNTAEYFTELDPTYTNESYRDYFRIGNQVELSNSLNVAFGIDVEKQYYNTSSWQNVEGTELVERYNTIPGSYTDDNLSYNDGTLLPLWDGTTRPDLNNPIEVLDGNGIYTLTQTDLKYSDENGGIYFQANANFILNYNFGIRLGNDDQNALRLGIEKGDFFFNIGNSFRKANLYEKFGDGVVQGNEELEPEKGVGVELGYGVLSVFMYDFEEAIEYVPGYYTDVITATLELNDDLSVNKDGTYGGCVLDPNYTASDGMPLGCVYTLVEDNNPVYTMPTYANTGEYTTAGMRYANNFGPLFVMLKYTDTDQTRLPKFAGVLQYSEDFFDVNFRIKYAFNLDRAPGPYDVLEEGQEYLEDLNKLNLYMTKEFTNGLTISFKAENITDEVVEVVPFYNTQGTEYYLTLGYTW
jgi:hypothetical protein